MCPNTNIRILCTTMKLMSYFQCPVAVGIIREWFTGAPRRVYKSQANQIKHLWRRSMLFLTILLVSSTHRNKATLFQSTKRFSPLYSTTVYLKLALPLKLAFPKYHFFKFKHSGRSNILKPYFCCQRK